MSRSINQRLTKFAHTGGFHRKSKSKSKSSASQPAPARPSVPNFLFHPIPSFLSLSLFSFFSLSLHPLFQHFIATKCTSKTKVWNACVFPLSLLGQFKGRSSGSRFFVSPIESRIKTEKKKCRSGHETRIKRIPQLQHLQHHNHQNLDHDLLYLFLFQSPPLLPPLQQQQQRRQMDQARILNNLRPC